MTNWVKLETYCPHCDAWNLGSHRGCPDSLIWLDTETNMIGCNKCNHRWHIDEDVLYCHCGNVQKTVVHDAALRLQVGEQIVRYDGACVYVRTSSGDVVVRLRDYPYSRTVGN